MLCILGLKVTGEHLLLTDEHWNMAQKVLTFLELFYDAIVTLSGVYYPTSPLMIHYLVKIAMHLKNYANDIHIRSVVQPMIDKYNKYWRDIPLLYSFAFILDPRAKMKGFTRVLRRLGALTSTDYSAYLLGTRARLTDVFNKYEEKFGSVRLKRPNPPTLSGKKRSAWMKFMMIMMLQVPLVVSILDLVLLTYLEIPLLLHCCRLQVHQLLMLLNLYPTWTVTL
jgi:hypothetical protein